MHIEVKRYRAGCAISNILTFTPWLFLNFWGIAYAVLSLFEVNCRFSKHLLILASLVPSILLSYIWIVPFADK